MPSHTCTRCSRINPPEASYCYFDGSALDGAAANGGPVRTGSQAFHNPFTFPSGKVCRNFDQLALACQEHWAETVELLQQGYLESFLGGLGRTDLALAAREAARFPDRDRGLDQFLAKLPTDVLEPPKIEVEPTEISLGQLRPGEDRQIELHLANKGMRLLYGSVTANCDWLGVGDGAGTTQKLFQFGGEQAVTVHVRGNRLRARDKPLEGRLLIESNGGGARVVVRAEVPVTPYPDGLFAGARTPRQLADKARAHFKTNLKETAAAFETGAVARWYRANGWDYPVQEPVAEGAAAVQQFFDALGLSRPPRVEISRTAVALAGEAGTTVQDALEIKAQERRPIYAYGKSDQPWLEVGRARLNGRTATLTLPLVVPAVPAREGETMHATVTIIANRKQRFDVAVSLEVGGAFNFASFAEPDAAPLAPPAPPAEAPAELSPPAPAPAAPAPEPAEAAPALPTFEPAAPADVRPRVKRPRTGVPPWLHAMPAGLLGLVLLGLVVLDVVRPPAAPTGGSDVEGTPYAVPLDDPEPRLGVKFNPSDRFGIVMLREHDPANPNRRKQLTAREDGETNNTCLRIDGFEDLFGKPPGEWVRRGRQPYRQVELGGGRKGYVSVWESRKVRVRQTVEILPNEQTRLLDTCLVHYLVENKDTIPHKVGLRVMLDTYIGANDGVPFAVPGQPGLLETMKRFTGKDIPDYIQALERSDLKDPGTVAHLGLKVSGLRAFPDDPEPEPLESVLVCRWPGTSEKKWSWDPRPMNDKSDGPNTPNDSCVVLYWPEEEMAPGARRAMAFTYGLGQVSSAEKGELAVATGGMFRPGGAFTVTAYVKNPQEGQKVKLILPEGLALDQPAGREPQAAEQVVGKAADYTQVSWRVRANAAGDYPIEVRSGLAVAHRTVRIRKAGLFD